MKSKKVLISIKLDDNRLVKLETCRNEEEAKARIARYEREDQQEIREGYGFPHGIPQYVITPV